MDYITKGILSYAEERYQFSKFELAKLKYMLEVIFLNTVEMVIIGAFFIAIGRAMEFFVSAGVLFSVRSFAGGFHIKKFRYCFVFTAVVFIFVILILPMIDITSTGLMEVLLFTSLAINAALAPVSKRKSGQSPKSRMIYKSISTAIILGYTVFLLNAKQSPYVEIITWTIFIQSTQLMIGKGMIMYEKKHTV